MTLKEMRAKRVALVADMRAIITKAEGENRDLTAEEIAAYDEKEKELNALKPQIARLEGLEAEETGLTATRGALGRTFTPDRAPGPEAAREFESLGEFMAAVRFRPNDQRLAFVEGVGANSADLDLAAEMRMDNQPSGGYMIPKKFREDIMSVPPQDALVRPRASVIPADPSSPDAGISMPALDQSGSAPGNMFGGMQFAWIAEGEDKPETDAKLREVSLTPKEVAGHVTVTDKLLRNWQGASTFLEKLMRGGVSAAEDYAFYRGDGVARPLGVINAGATKFVNRATANTVKYADVVGMLAVLLMRGGAPVWSAPQSVLPQLMTMKDENNNLIWQANARDGFAGTLLGHPLRWNNRGPALGSKGDLVLADWSQYLIKDGSGPFVAASEHVKFLQNKTVIKIFWNVDGAPWLNAPIQEENGYSVSPFVGLDVPA